MFRSGLSFHVCFSTLSHVRTIFGSYFGCSKTKGTDRELYWRFYKPSDRPNERPPARPKSSQKCPSDTHLLLLYMLLLYLHFICTNTYYCLIYIYIRYTQIYSSQFPMSRCHIGLRWHSTTINMRTVHIWLIFIETIFRNRKCIHFSYIIEHINVYILSGRGLSWTFV